MAASAADIRSALSIPEGNASAGPSQPKKPKPPTTKKPDGIPRELYSLIGPSAPSLAAQFAKPRLKQKPNLGGGAAKTKWELRPFKNGARQDNLELRHWKKVTPNPPAEYPFTKYNIQSTSYTYSQDEYNRFLEDKEWTKEETDYLFSVVQDYDSRWYIIYDRYEYPDGPNRSLEDLKDRYYSVCRKLVRNRPWAGDEASKAQLISSFQFDKEREMTRKKYIVSLENRTADQAAEEEALYVEVKRLEHTERKFKKERESLLRILAGIDSGLPDIVEDDVSLVGAPSNEIKGLAKTVKKKAGTADIDSPATPSASASSAIKRPNTAKNAAFGSSSPVLNRGSSSFIMSFPDAHHCIIRTDPPTTGLATKAAHHPAYLRSFKLPTPKAAIAPKITQALAELGISHSRLVMPTRDNIAQLESLLEATTALVETKRVVDKVEYDIQVLKNRLGTKENSQGDGDVEMKTEGGGDENESRQGGEGENEEGEDGRAQSVLSARSARSRKHARRSMSISSVDTVSTRAGTKRQKRG